MQQACEIISTGAGAPVYRLRAAKADGRELLLYGLTPPSAARVGPELDREPPTAGELRQHPLRGDWAIYAAARQGRTFKPAAVENPLAPAAPGRATEIPFPDYEVAVFENRFPSLTPNSAAPSSGPANVVQAPAHGRCEVIVYSSDANRDLLTIGEERRRLLVRVWIDRYAELFNRGLDYVLPFENRGEEVGVTLTHPHGQIYAFGQTPQLQVHAASVFANGYDLSKRLREWRAEFGVTDAGGLLAFVPPFARFPYETWIAPLSPHAGPWSFSAEEIEGFAYLIGEMTRRYDALFGRKTPFMLTLHAAPRGPSSNYCFTAQFYPLLRAPGRLKYLASVEQATGMFTVDVMPERAALELRAQ